MLELEVSGQRLMLKKMLFVVADSVNYLKLRITFSAEWDGLVKTAIFKDASKGKTYHVLLDSDGVCIVPWEVISAPRFYVSVFGGERITTNDCEIHCELSGYENGGEPSTPTADIYAQIISMIEGIHIPTKVSELANDEGYITKATLLGYNYVTSADLQELENTLNDVIKLALQSLGEGMTEHKLASVLDHPDGSVTTAKLADGAVNSDKLAEDSVTNSKIKNGAVSTVCLADGAVQTDKVRDGAITAEKLADGVIPTELPASGGDADTVGGKRPSEFATASHTHSVKNIEDLELHAHDNKSVIDKLSESEDGKLLFDGEEISGSSSDSGESEIYDITPLSEFADNANNESMYSFPYEVGEEFAVKNDLGENVDYLLSGGDPVWNFSKVLEAGKSYLLSISVRPVSGAEWNNGEITVIKEVRESYLTARVTALETRMDNVEAVVGDANAVLETLLTEGV